MSGWPDPARPGVPLNPERDGWHLWSAPHAEAPSVAEWSAFGYWRPGLTPESMAHFTYHGPLYNAAELAAREAAAFKRGAEAMREQAAREIECGCAEEFRRKVASVPPNAADRWNLCGSTHCPAIDAAAIRALPVETAKE